MTKLGKFLAHLAMASRRTSIKLLPQFSKLISANDKDEGVNEINPLNLALFLAETLIDR